MAIQIRNPGSSSISLPNPLRGIVPAGGAVVVAATMAQMVALLGGPSFRGGLELTEVSATAVDPFPLGAQLGQVGFSPLLVPEIVAGSWFSPSRGLSGVGAGAITITDQCPNPLALTTDVANGTATVLPLGAPPAFVATLGFTNGSGAYNSTPAAKLQPSVELYVAGWLSVSEFAASIAALVAQYNTGGTTGNKMFALYATSSGGGQVAFRVRNQDDTANIVVSYPEVANDPHFVEGVYRNQRVEIWRDRLLMASAAGPVRMPNTLTETCIFNEAAKGNSLGATAKNIYVSPRVPADANRDLLMGFEPLGPTRRRRYFQVTPPVLGTGALGVATATVSLGSSFLVEGDRYSVRPLGAIPGGGALLGVRTSALNTLELQFLGPTTAVGTGFVVEN